MGTAYAWLWSEWLNDPACCVGFPGFLLETDQTQTSLWRKKHKQQQQNTNKKTPPHPNHWVNDVLD